MLDNAGITDSTTQLEIVRHSLTQGASRLAFRANMVDQNIILNAWCLVVAAIGTTIMDKFGRKTNALISTGLLTVFIFMIGGLTKAYGSSDNTSGVYGTVAAIFLFQGAYSIAWTPLTVLYPPEVLNYPIRANGMAVYSFFTNGAG